MTTTRPKVPPTKVATVRLAATASHLTHLYHEACYAPVGMSARAAKAKIDGACSTMHALGFGNTPTEVYYVLMDAHNDMGRMHGDRPPYIAGRNDAQKNWDAAMSGLVHRRLEEMT